MKSSLLKTGLRSLAFPIAFVFLETVPSMLGSAWAASASEIPDVLKDEEALVSQAPLLTRALEEPRFIEHALWHGLRSVSRIAVADLDGDEDLDVVAASYAANTILWFENDGRERFSRHVVDDSFFGVTWVEAADLDGDSDQDIIASTTEAQALAWWENDGAGTFSRRIIDASYEFLWNGCAIGDLDNDQDVDVGGGTSGGGLAWWENDGTGQFIRHVLPSEDKARS